MRGNLFFIGLTLALAFGLVTGACSNSTGDEMESSSGGGNDDDSDEDDDDDNDDDDGPNNNNDDGDNTSTSSNSSSDSNNIDDGNDNGTGDGTTPITSSQWTCPIDWPTYTCVSSLAECQSADGQVPAEYSCEGGGVCCDTTPAVVEGPDPCPVDQEGVSCQFSWECWKADGGLLWEDYYCTGDNTLCCYSPGLKQINPPAPEDTDNDVPSDTGTGPDEVASDTAVDDTVCPTDNPLVSCMSEDDCEDQNGIADASKECDGRRQVCCVVTGTPTDTAVDDRTPCPVEESSSIACLTEDACTAAGGTADAVNYACETEGELCCAGITEEPTDEPDLCPEGDGSEATIACVDDCSGDGRSSDATSDYQCADSNQTCCVIDFCPVDAAPQIECVADCAGLGGVQSGHQCANEGSSCCVIPDSIEPCPVEQSDAISCETVDDCAAGGTSDTTNYFCPDDTVCCVVAK